MLKNSFNNIYFKSLNIICSETKTRFYHSACNNIILYDDALNSKKKILQDNKQKCGIYKWVNKLNGKSYIGSSVNLSSRFSNYFSLNYLLNKTSKYNSIIYNALLTHGHENFCLEILEYCERSNVIKKEQFYINYFKPEYNILSIAGSSLNFKHSEETLLKFKSRKLSSDALSNLRKSKVSAVLSFLAKANQLLSTSHIIIIKNIVTNDSEQYSSIRSAAKKFEVSHATLLNYIDKNKLFKGKYIIKKKIKKKRN